MNCPGCPVAEIDRPLGMMVSEVICSAAPFVTVNVATPVTTLVSGFDATAVIATEPCVTAVTSPGVAGQLAAMFRLAFAGEQTVATPGLLEIHVTWYWPVAVVKFCVAGDDENVPVATSWLV
jgi:hypothetical protein